MKLCKNCKEKVDNTSLFCPYCGENKFEEYNEKNKEKGITKEKEKGLNNKGNNQNQKKEQKENNAKQNYNYLKKISVSEDMFNSLYPLTLDSTRYRAIFHGKTGTDKERSIKNVANFLYRCKKISKNEVKYISFVDLPNEIDSNTLYVVKGVKDAIKNLFNLEDFSDEASKSYELYHKKMFNLINYKRDSFVIIDCDSSDLTAFLRLNPKLEYVFNNKIEFRDLTDEEIYNVFKGNLSKQQKKNIKESEDKKRFLAWMNDNKRYFPFQNKDLGIYLANHSATFSEITLPENKASKNTLEKSFEGIIGMKDLKDQAFELQRYLKYVADSSKHNIKLPDLRLHMMFLGDPGTGKTTIARILGKCLFNLGFIRENKFIETTSKDFVGAYANQTSMKTSRLISQALGGVLFIDEAYSLSNSAGKAGEEAIALLVKAMEDYRGELVIFFAGYTKEMGMFLKSNSGLSSRINYYFKFKNYTQEELKQIFIVKIKNTGLIFDESVSSMEKLEQLLSYGDSQKDMGNGRFVDKIVQKTLTTHATLVEQGKADFLKINEQDIPELDEFMKSFY